MDKPEKLEPSRPKRQQQIPELFDSTRPYIVEALYPAYEVHLIGGPSGSGKTRYGLQLIVDQIMQGQKVFGWDSHPVPWCYISADRSYASICDTCRDLGYDPATLPILPIRDLETDATNYSIPWVIQQVKKFYPGSQLLVIESIGTFIPAGKINDYQVVSKFFRDLGRRCRREKITIIGIHHTSKEKADTAFSNDREKLLGSAAFSGFTETITMIAPAEPSNPKSPYRRVSIFPRNRTAAFTVGFKFGDEGRLIELAAGEKLPDARTGRPKRGAVTEEINRFFTALAGKKKHDFTITEILDFTKGSASRATVTRRLEELCDEGTLERSGTNRATVYTLVNIRDTKGFEALMP
jgi:hypothetical protein